MGYFGYGRGAVGLVLLTVVLTIAAGCGEKPSGSPSDQPKSAFHFVLAGSGLAKDGLWKGTPLFADFNADGFLDLAAMVRLGKGPHIWLGNGRGEWNDVSKGLAMSSSCGGGLAAGDINQDGHLDLAVADHCYGLFVYLGDGRGNMQQVAGPLNPAVATNLSESAQQERDFFTGSEDLALGDLNEDGFLDMVGSGTSQGGFTVYYGDGSGANWREESEPDGLPSFQDPEPEDEENGGWANQVLLYDMNRDGHLDVVASYYKGPGVWLGDGTGKFRPLSQGLPVPTTGGLYRGIAIGDINEDGRPDLVAMNRINGAEVYLQGKDGSWAIMPDFMPAIRGSYAVALGDFDRDGHLDLITSGRKSKDQGSIFGLFVCRGDGKGKFAPVEDSGLPSEGLATTWGIGVGDVNNDGLPDFALTTGGAVPGGPKSSRKPPLQSKKSGSEGNQPTTGSPTPERRYVDELPLPRVQVWLNQSAR